MNDSLIDTYSAIRHHTEAICAPLKTEDYVVQPVVDVSPPKWHIGHTTWFFETLVLKQYHPHYQEFHPDYNYVFNSYYESLGARVIRTDRGNISRPAVEDIYSYRKHVDAAMVELLSGAVAPQVRDIVILGINHEQQHQGLLYADIKYMFGHNPLFPAYDEKGIERVPSSSPDKFISIEEGVYSIGFKGGGFCFDNELQRHKVYLQSYEIAAALVTTAEYFEFIEAGGYQDFRYWYSEGWDWVKTKQAQAPLYWHNPGCNS